MEIHNIEILLIDDEALHAEIFKRKLLNLGYNNIIVLHSYSSAIDYLDLNTPDLIILDYYLDKSQTGVEVVKESLLNKEIPVIFISTFYGEDIFREIIGVAPFDFLPKNVNEFDLDKSIKLTKAKKVDFNLNKKLKDYIFVKSSKEIRKLAIADVEFIMVDGKYLVLHSDQKKYLIRSTLNDFFKRLPDNFIKVHQAYIINLRYLETIQIEEGLLKVGKYSVPYSRNHKKELFNSYFLP